MPFGIIDGCIHNDLSSAPGNFSKHEIGFKECLLFMDASFMVKQGCQLASVDAIKIFDNIHEER